jgi:outer membrane protein
MINLLKVTILIFVSFFFINSSFSNENTGFVNIDYILQNSNIGKKLLEDINNKDEENIENLRKKNKFLKELELSIISKKNIISTEAYNKEVEDFKKKFAEFSSEKNQIVNEFNNFKKNELENFFKKISPTINDYMKENSIKILFDSKNIFIGAQELNFTEDVLKKINKELK